MKIKLSILAVFVSLFSFSQIKIKDLPTTTTGSTLDYLLKDAVAGTPGSTQKISIANFITTYSLQTTPGISGLTTNYIPVATSSTTLGNGYLYQSGYNVVVPNGKKISGADTAKSIIGFGTSGSKITLQAIAGNYSKTYLEQDATSFVNIVSDAGVTNTYTINEMGRIIASWGMYDNVGATRSGIEVQNGSGSTGYNVGGLSIKLASSVNAITANTNSTWATFLNARNATYTAGITNSAIIGGNGRTATASNTVYVPSLDISGGLKYVDGNQGASKVLTSDASGNATWQTPSGGLTGATGDLISFSGTNTQSNITSVSAGSYLRSGGVSTAPVWSTTKLLNAGTANYIPYWSSTNTQGESANLQFNGTALGIGMTPTNILDITQNQNALSRVNLLNSTSGTTARAGFLISNGTTTGGITHMSAGYTSATGFIADGTTLSGSGAAGVNLSATHASGAVGFYTGGSSTLRGFVDASGNFGMGVATSLLSTLHVSGNASTAITLQSAATTPNPTINYVSSRGTVASPTATQSGDVLGAFGAKGRGSSAFGFNTATITFKANQTFTDANQGTYTAFETTPDGSTTRLERLKISASGSVIIGNSSSALATTATDGFLYVPSCAGLPTGVPTAVTGTIPIIIDSTNNRMYIYSGGAWVALN